MRYKHIQLRYFLVLITLFCIGGIQATSFDIQKAREAYAAGDYASAVALYESLTEEGVSPELYYNLGNAYYKLNKPAHAILNYERALQLSPSYDDAIYNLKLVNAQIKDQIVPVEEFFFSRWIRECRSLLNSNKWAVLSIVFFSCFLVCLLLYVFSRYRWMRKTAFFVGSLFVICSLVFFVFSYQQKRAELQRAFAIVMEGSVIVRSSPDESGTQLFVIHEGSKVKIRTELGEWAEITIADGNSGWLKMSNIERI